MNVMPRQNKMMARHKMKSKVTGNGFTLIELMVVVVIIALLMAIAIPSYREYVRRANASQVQQEIQKIAEQLERHKIRNFSYMGFDVGYLYKDKNGVISPSYTKSTASLTFPVDKPSNSNYTIYIRDGLTPTTILTDNTVRGQQWAILAVANSKINYGDTCTTCNSVQDDNYSFLMTSLGVKCKTKLSLKEKDTLTSTNLKSAKPCGDNSERW